MRVLVCGSRTWKSKARIFRELNEIGATLIIDGCAPGADTLGHEAARELGLETERFPADWKAFGKAAGHIRNQLMLESGKPDKVLAFWDGASRGTLDMIRRAQAAQIPTRIILEHTF